MNEKCEIDVNQDISDVGAEIRGLEDLPDNLKKCVLGVTRQLEILQTRLWREGV